MDLLTGHLPASRLIVLRSPSPPRAPSVLMGHDGGSADGGHHPSARHARFQGHAEAAFAPPRANMVLAASATAFERPHCVPVVVRERRTADLCGRLIPSAVWGARGWDRGAIDGGVEAVPRWTAAVRADKWLEMPASMSTGRAIIRIIAAGAQTATVTMFSLAWCWCSAAPRTSPAAPSSSTATSCARCGSPPPRPNVSPIHHTHTHCPTMSSDVQWCPVPGAISCM